MPASRLQGQAAEVLVRSLLLASLLVAFPALGQDGAPYPLVEVDFALQAGLDELVAARKLDRLAAEKRLGLALVDLTGETPRAAFVNGDHLFYAASLPKIAVLLGAFQAEADGLLAPDPAREARLTAMIRRSSNRATSLTIAEVGFATIADTVRDPRYRLYADGVGLWVGKDYRPGGDATRWRDDPTGHQRQLATARQAARFFVLLERGLLVSPQASARMKALLGEPKIAHKFVAGLGDRDVAIYRKSGTTRYNDTHCDAALIEHGLRTYVAVGLVWDPAGEELLRALIRDLDDLIRRAPLSGSSAPGPSRGFSDALGVVGGRRRP